MYHLKVLSGGRKLCSLPSPEGFTSHLTFGEPQSLPAAWFGCGHYPALDKRTPASFCRQHTEISLLREYIWLSCDAWVDFSSLKVTQPGTPHLTLLVFVIIKFLLIKLHLLMGVLFTVCCGLRSALGSARMKRWMFFVGTSPLYLLSGGNSKRIKNSCRQSMFGPVCTAAQVLLGKSEGLLHQFPCLGYEDYLFPRVGLRMGQLAYSSSGHLAAAWIGSLVHRGCPIVLSIVGGSLSPMTCLGALCPEVKNVLDWGQPRRCVVKFVCSTMAAQGFAVLDSGHGHGTAYEAMLRQRPMCHNWKDPKLKYTTMYWGDLGRKVRKKKNVLNCKTYRGQEVTIFCTEIVIGLIGSGRDWSKVELMSPF